MKDEDKENTGRAIRYQIAGWILFVFCALLFAVSSLKNNDTPAFIGSVLFFVACIVFLIPLVRSKRG